MSRKWQFRRSIFLKAIAGIQYIILSQKHLNSVSENRVDCRVKKFSMSILLVASRLRHNNCQSDVPGLKWLAVLFSHIWSKSYKKLHFALSSKTHSHMAKVSLQSLINKFGNLKNSDKKFWGQILSSVFVWHCKVFDNWKIFVETFVMC